MMLPPGARARGRGDEEAKTRFSRPLDRAQEGQEFVIAKAGRPVARLGSLRRPGKKRDSSSSMRRTSLAGPIMLLTNDAVLVGYGPVVQLV